MSWKERRYPGDRTGEWLKMTQAEINTDLQTMSVKRIKQAAKYIMKPGDARLRIKSKLIERILLRMKAYRSRFEYGK